jgi:hypothetical protein
MRKTNVKDLRLSLVGDYLVQHIAFIFHSASKDCDNIMILQDSDTLRWCNTRGNNHFMLTYSGTKRFLSFGLIDPVTILDNICEKG